MRPGTTISLRGAPPFSAFTTLSVFSTTASISAAVISFGTVISSRRLPLIWIGSVTLSSVSQAASARGQGAVTTRP